jgi:LIM domain kinase 1
MCNTNNESLSVNKPLTLPMIYLTRLDVSTDLMSLHIGDRILEVNGTPVKDLPLESIEKLIESTDKVLQLTIEHDPGQCCVSVVPQAGKGDEQGVPLQTIDINQNSPAAGGGNKLDKERLFKRKDEGYISGTKTRQLRKAKHMNCSNGELLWI